MNTLAGLDWADYFHGLSDGEIGALAAWLVAERLEVGEFIEVVDREYALISDEWREPPPDFVARFARFCAGDYARRKRRFAALLAAFEEARMAGAMPGDVAPEELKPPPSHSVETSSLTEVRETLEYARRGLV